MQDKLILKKREVYTLRFSTILHFLYFYSDLYVLDLEYSNKTRCQVSVVGDQCQMLLFKVSNR